MNACPIVLEALIMSSCCCVCVSVHTHTSIYVLLPKSVVVRIPPPVSLMVLIYFGWELFRDTRSVARVLLLLPPTTYIYIVYTRPDCNPLLLLSSSLLFSFFFLFFFFPARFLTKARLPRSLIIIRIPPVWIFLLLLSS